MAEILGKRRTLVARRSAHAARSGECLGTGQSPPNMPSAMSIPLRPLGDVSRMLSVLATNSRLVFPERRLLDGLFVRLNFRSWRGADDHRHRGWPSSAMASAAAGLVALLEIKGVRLAVVRRRR